MYSIRSYFERVYLMQRLRRRSLRYQKEIREAVRSLDRFARAAMEAGRLPPEACISEDGEIRLRLAALSDEVVSAWLSEAGQSRSAATEDKLLRHVRVLWTHAWRARLVQERTRLEEAHERVEPKQAPTPEEIERLFGAARMVQGEICGITAADWWTALLLTEYYSALRCSPLMALRCSDVDLKERTLHVLACSTKERRARWFCKLPDCWIAAVAAIGISGRELLFPWPLDHRPDGRPNGNWKRLRASLVSIAETAHIRTGKGFGFHSLRRYVATRVTCAASIGEAQRILGHSAARVTELYVDPTQAPDRVCPAEYLPPPFGSGPEPQRLRIVG